MASAAETTPRSRRRSFSWRRAGGEAVPYGLILPVVLVLGAILGYPIYSLVRLSLQQYGLFELIRHQGRYVGLHNFGLVLHDPVFWHTVVRTIIFTIANVGLTMTLGTMPVIRPVLLILTSLSILWDFGVFTQPYLLIGQPAIHPGNYLMAIYLFEEGYFKNDYGRGAAISLLMLVIVAAMSVVYVRKMVRIGEVQ